MSKKQIYLVGQYEIDRSYRMMHEQPHISSFADYFKIGIAENPEARVSGMQSGNPHKLRLITTVDSDDPKEVESSLHRLNRYGRQRGEWFRLGGNMINSLKALEFIDSSTLRSIVKNNYILDSEKSLYVKLMEHPGDSE